MSKEILIKNIKAGDLTTGQTIILNDIDTTLSKSNLKPLDTFWGTVNVNGVSLRKDTTVQIRLFPHYVGGEFVSNVDMR